MKFKKFICISTIICTVSLSFLGCKDTDSSSADTPEVKSESQTSASANAEISETPTPDDGQSEEKSSDEVQSIKAENSQTDSQVLEQYKIILSQADSYPYDSTGSNIPTGNYKYALVQMQSDNPIPALLLSQETQNGLYFIRVFQYNPDDQTMSQPSETITEGTAGVGGFRGSLGIMRDGNGLSLTEVSSGTGDMSVSRVTLEGGSISTSPEWNGRLGDSVPEALNSETINWNDVSNTDALDNWTAVTSNSTEASNNTENSSEGTALESSEEPEEAALPEDSGRIVFQGTIDNYSYDQVIALQGTPDPNGGSSTGISYHLIVLDTPQVMDLRSGGDPGTRSGEVSMIRIFSSEGLSQYNGQHLTFSIDPNQTYWPSDTSLPVGQPGTSDIKVLN